MAATAQTPERPDWLHDVNSMLASASFHLVFLIAVGLLAVGNAHGPRGNSVELSLGGGVKGGDATFLDDTPLGNAASLDESVGVASALAPTPPLDESALSANPVDQLTSALAPSATDLESLGAASTTSGKGRGQEGTGSGGPADGGTGRGGGQGDGILGKSAAEFFGIGGYGQKFVYVVDCSDSMNDHDKFMRARYELLRSIEQLGREQRYYVIFYSDGAYPMDADEPVRATPDQVLQTTHWINSVEPTGGTNPLPALLYALSLRPDAIYFLSDGQFDPLTIQELRSRNRPNKRTNQKMIPIHTIAFYDRFAEGLMRTIARNSGGEYRFVK